MFNIFVFFHFHSRTREELLELLLKRESTSFVHILQVNKCLICCRCCIFSRAQFMLHKMPTRWYRNGIAHANDDFELKLNAFKPRDPHHWDFNATNTLVLIIFIVRRCVQLTAERIVLFRRNGLVLHRLDRIFLSHSWLHTEKWQMAEKWYAIYFYRLSPVDLIDDNFDCPII